MTLVNTVDFDLSKLHEGLLHSDTNEMSDDFGMGLNLHESLQCDDNTDDGHLFDGQALLQGYVPIGDSLVLLNGNEEEMDDHTQLSNNEMNQEKENDDKFVCKDESCHSVDSDHSGSRLQTPQAITCSHNDNSNSNSNNNDNNNSTNNNNNNTTTTTTTNNNSNINNSRSQDNGNSNNSVDNNSNNASNDGGTNDTSTCNESTPNQHHEMYNEQIESRTCSNESGNQDSMSYYGTSFASYSSWFGPTSHNNDHMNDGHYNHGYSPQAHGAPIAHGASIAHGAAAPPLYMMPIMGYPPPPPFATYPHAHGHHYSSHFDMAFDMPDNCHNPNINSMNHLNNMNNMNNLNNIGDINDVNDVNDMNDINNGNNMNNINLSDSNMNSKDNDNNDNNDRGKNDRNKDKSGDMNMDEDGSGTPGFSLALEPLNKSFDNISENGNRMNRLIKHKSTSPNIKKNENTNSKKKCVSLPSKRRNAIVKNMNNKNNPIDIDKMDDDNNDNDEKDDKSSSNNNNNNNNNKKRKEIDIELSGDDDDDDDDIDVNLDRLNRELSTNSNYGALGHIRQRRRITSNNCDSNDNNDNNNNDSNDNNDNSDNNTPNDNNIDGTDTSEKIGAFDATPIHTSIAAMNGFPQGPPPPPPPPPYNGYFAPNGLPYGGAMPPGYYPPPPMYGMPSGYMGMPPPPPGAPHHAFSAPYGPPHGYPYAMPPPPPPPLAGYDHGYYHHAPQSNTNLLHGRSLSSHHMSSPHSNDNNKDDNNSNNNNENDNSQCDVKANESQSVKTQNSMDNTVSTKASTKSQLSNDNLQIDSCTINLKNKYEMDTLHYMHVAENNGNTSCFSPSDDDKNENILKTCQISTKPVRLNGYQGLNFGINNRYMNNCNSNSIGRTNTITPSVTPNAGMATNGMIVNTIRRTLTSGAMTISTTPAMSSSAKRTNNGKNKKRKSSKTKDKKHKRKNSKGKSKSKSKTKTASKTKSKTKNKIESKSKSKSKSKNTPLNRAISQETKFGVGKESGGIASCDIGNNDKNENVKNVFENDETSCYIKIEDNDVMDNNNINDNNNNNNNNNNIINSKTINDNSIKNNNSPRIPSFISQSKNKSEESGIWEIMKNVNDNRIEYRDDSLGLSMDNAMRMLKSTIDNDSNSNSTSSPNMTTFGSDRGKNVEKWERKKRKKSKTITESIELNDSFDDSNEIDNENENENENENDDDDDIEGYNEFDIGDDMMMNEEDFDINGNSPCPDGADANLIQCQNCFRTFQTQAQFGQHARVCGGRKKCVKKVEKKVIGSRTYQYSFMEKVVKNKLEVRTRFVVKCKNDDKADNWKAIAKANHLRDTAVSTMLTNSNIHNVTVSIRHRKESGLIVANFVQKNVPQRPESVGKAKDAIERAVNVVKANLPSTIELTPHECKIEDCHELVIRDTEGYCSRHRAQKYHSGIRAMKGSKKDKKSSKNRNKNETDDDNYNDNDNDNDNENENENENDNDEYDYDDDNESGNYNVPNIDKIVKRNKKKKKKKKSSVKRRKSKSKNSATKNIDNSSIPPQIPHLHNSALLPPPPPMDDEFGSDLFECMNMNMKQESNSNNNNNNDNSSSNHHFMQPNSDELLSMAMPPPPPPHSGASDDHFGHFSGLTPLGGGFDGLDDRRTNSQHNHSGNESISDFMPNLHLDSNNMHHGIHFSQFGQMSPRFQVSPLDESLINENDFINNNESNDNKHGIIKNDDSDYATNNNNNNNNGNNGNNSNNGNNDNDSSNDSNYSPIKMEPIESESNGFATKRRENPSLGENGEPPAKKQKI